MSDHALAGRLVAAIADLEAHGYTVTPPAASLPDVTVVTVQIYGREKTIHIRRSQGKK